MAQKFPQTPPAAMDSIQQMAIRIKKQQRRLYMVGLLTLTGVTGFSFSSTTNTNKTTWLKARCFRLFTILSKKNLIRPCTAMERVLVFLDIVKEYRFTQAANLAHFYIGVSYMHQRDYTKAVQHLTKFRSKDLLLQARAWALVGDAYTENKNYPLAVNFYMKAAGYQPNKIFTPVYLTKAALAYEAKEDFTAALGCYQRIVQEFPEAAQYREALKHTARLKSISTQHQPLPSQKIVP